MPIDAPVPQVKLSHKWSAISGSVPNSSRIIAKMNMTHPFTVPGEAILIPIQNTIRAMTVLTTLQRNSVQNFPAYRDLRGMLVLRYPVKLPASSSSWTINAARMLMASGTTSAAHAMKYP